MGIRLPRKLSLYLLFLIPIVSLQLLLLNTKRGSDSSEPISTPNVISLPKPPNLPFGAILDYTERNLLCREMIATNQSISANPTHAREVFVIRTTFSSAHQADPDYWLNLCNWVLENHAVGRAVAILVDVTNGPVIVPTSPLNFYNLVVFSHDEEVRREIPGYQGQWMDGCVMIAHWATKQPYEYIWWAEDDVRYIGHMGALFDLLPHTDLSAFGRVSQAKFDDPDGWMWALRENIHGPWLEAMDNGTLTLWSAFLPVGGMSPRLARAVSHSSAQGNAGNQELHIPTVAHHHGLSVRTTALPGALGLEGAPWCPFLKGEKRPVGEMYHPMKPMMCTWV